MILHNIKIWFKNFLGKVYKFYCTTFIFLSLFLHNFNTICLGTHQKCMCTKSQTYIWSSTCSTLNYKKRNIVYEKKCFSFIYLDNQQTFFYRQTDQIVTYWANKESSHSFKSQSPPSCGLQLDHIEHQQAIISQFWGLMNILGSNIKCIIKITCVWFSSLNFGNAWDNGEM
jgi:hypothetical protein